jgi:hypothetical protein
MEAYVTATQSRIASPEAGRVVAPCGRLEITMFDERVLGVDNRP